MMSPLHWASDLALSRAVLVLGHPLPIAMYITAYLTITVKDYFF